MSESEIKKLKVSVKDGKACQKILKIEVPQERVTNEFATFYASIAPKAKIPGFRPGKAPKHVLEMHYKDKARESVLKELITETYRQAVQENSIVPLGYPEVEDVDFKDDQLSYKAKVEIRPRIKLSKVAGLKAKKESSEVKEDEVTESLKRVQDSMAQFKAVEDRPAQIGDFVIIDYQAECDGQELDKRKDDWVELNEEKEFYKGFSKQLVGVKAEEEKEIRLQLPKDFFKKEFAEKEAVFKINVKEIKAKSLPALDDDLAKSLGKEFKTLAELKDKIKEDLAKAKEKDAQVKYEKALMDELMKHNKIDLPEGLVKRRQDHLVSDTLHHYQSQGIPEDTLKDMAGKIKDEYAEEAKRQIHLAFLLDEIAIQQKIEVTDQDRKEKMKELAAQVQQPVEAVEQYYQADGERRAALEDQIRNQKAIDYIKSNAKDK